MDDSLRRLLPCQTLQAHAVNGYQCTPERNKVFKDSSLKQFRLSLVNAIQNPLQDLDNM